MLDVLQTVYPAVLLQMTPNPGGPTGPVPGVNPLTQLVSNTIGTFVVTLVVGAILIAVAEEFTEARMTDVLEEPLGSGRGVRCRAPIVSRVTDRGRRRRRSHPRAIASDVIELERVPGAVPRYPELTGSRCSCDHSADRGSFIRTVDM